MLGKKILKIPRWRIKFNLIENTNQNSPKTFLGKLETGEILSPRLRVHYLDTCAHIPPVTDKQTVLHMFKCHINMWKI